MGKAWTLGTVPNLGQPDFGCRLPSLRQKAMLSRSSAPVQGRLKHIDWKMDAEALKTLGEPGPDTGRREGSDHFPIRRNSLPFEDEKVLHRDHVGLHPGNFRDMRETAGSVM